MTRDLRHIGRVEAFAHFCNPQTERQQIRIDLVFRRTRRALLRIANRRQRPE